MLKLSILLAVVICSSSQAQTIYQPPQYQYGSGNDVYFYGGSDPRVFDRAQRDASARQVKGVPDTRLQVYSDALPCHPNAAVYGVTPADAANQAYSSMPRYFRMRDLAGRVETDGSVTVPPTAGGAILVKPHLKPVRPATTKPGVIIIIPTQKPTTPVAMQSDPVTQRPA